MALTSARGVNWLVMSNSKLDQQNKKKNKSLLITPNSKTDLVSSGYRVNQVRKKGIWHGCCKHWGKPILVLMFPNITGSQIPPHIWVYLLCSPGGMGWFSPIWDSEVVGEHDWTITRSKKKKKKCQREYDWVLIGKVNQKITKKKKNFHNEWEAKTRGKSIYKTVTFCNTKGHIYKHHPKNGKTLKNGTIIIKVEKEKHVDVLLKTNTFHTHTKK